MTRGPCHRAVSPVLLCLGALLLVSPVQRVLADGGMVVHQEATGPWWVTVFVAPAPPRAGELTLEVLVQHVETGAIVVSPEVTIAAVLTSPGQEDDPPGSMTATSPITAVAAPDDGASALVLAAPMTLAPAGRWDIDVALRSPDGEGVVGFELEVRPAPAAWTAQLPWLLAPFLALGAVVVHQWLVHRGVARRERVLTR